MSRCEWHALLQQTDICTGNNRAAHLVHPPIYKLIKLDIPTSSFIQQFHCCCQLIVIQIDVLLWPAYHILCTWIYATSSMAKTYTQHENRKMKWSDCTTHIWQPDDRNNTSGWLISLHAWTTVKWCTSATSVTPTSISQKEHTWRFAEVMQCIGSTAYASRLSSNSSSRISSFKSYLLKMAAISAASLSERPYFSGLKPYVSFALLSVKSAERFLRVDASAFSFCSTSVLFQACRGWEPDMGRWSAALRWVKHVIMIQGMILTCCVPTAVCADMTKHGFDIMSYQSCFCCISQCVRPKLSCKRSKHPM